MTLRYIEYIARAEECKRTIIQSEPFCWGKTLDIPYPLPLLRLRARHLKEHFIPCLPIARGVLVLNSQTNAGEGGGDSTADFRICTLFLVLELYWGWMKGKWWLAVWVGRACCKI